jgi:hypothetical protein
MSALRRQLSYANVMATIAVFIALGGGAYALSGKNTVASDDIINGQVKAEDIGGNQVKTADIAASQVTGGKVAADTLFGADIGADAIGASEVGPGAVGASEVADGTLGTAEIDDSSLFNDNSLNALDVNEGTLFNDNSLTSLDIDEPSLFNDSSLDGADVNEAGLVGLQGGLGDTSLIGGKLLPLNDERQVPVAGGDGIVEFGCSGGSSFGFTNQSGQPVRIFHANREIVFEDDGTPNNGQLAMSSNAALANNATESIGMVGVGNIGLGEVAVITDSHVVWARAMAFSGPMGCDFVIWLTEEPL